MEDVRDRLNRFLKGVRYEPPEKYRDQYPLEDSPLTDEDIDSILDNKINAGLKERDDFIRGMKSKGGISKEEMNKQLELKVLEIQDRIRQEMKPYYEEKPYRTGKFVLA